MFSAKPRADEILLSSEADIHRRRDLRRGADDLLETSRVGTAVQPSACAAGPGRDLQAARRCAPFPGCQEWIEWRAQVPGTLQGLGEHFELCGKCQAAEGHRA